MMHVSIVFKLLLEMSSNAYLQQMNTINFQTMSGGYLILKSETLQLHW